MNILALDLGTKMGYCAGDTGAIPEAGTIVWATAKEITQLGLTRLTRIQDARVLRLHKWLVERLQNTKPNWIIFEDVEFSTHTKQTQLWSAYRTTVWIAAAACDVKVECVPVTTLKKFATGSGAADKPLMEKFLRRRHPEIKVAGDDAIDACWVWLWARETLKRA